MPRGHAATTVEEYLAVVPVDQVGALTAVRSVLWEIIPDASEKIRYQIPVFSAAGRALLGLSAAQKHCSLHLMSPPLARELAAGGELSEGTISGATLQFPNDRPLMRATLELIVRRRLAALG